MLLIFAYHFFVEFSKRSAGIRLPRIFTGESGLACNPVAVAVSLFFMVSGASLMLSAREENAASFFKRRFRSVMLPFYVVFIIGFIGTLVFFPERYAGIPAWTILLSVFGMDGYLLEILPNFYVTGEWFLGCLILMYLCFPFLKKAVERQPVLTAALTIAVWAVLLAFFDVPLFEARDRWFFLRLPEFMCGMYFSKYLKESGKKYYGMLGLLLTAFWFFPLFPERFELVQRLLVTSGLFMAFRCAGELLEGRTGPAERAIHFFADNSYGFFLLHHFAILLAALLLPAVLGEASEEPWALILMMTVLFAACLFGGWLLGRMPKTGRSRMKHRS